MSFMTLSLDILSISVTFLSSLAMSTFVGASLEALSASAESSLYDRNDSEPKLKHVPANAS